MAADIAAVVLGLGQRTVAAGRGDLERVALAQLGELVGATDSDVTIAAPTGVVSIAYDDIQRSNLVGE